MVLPGSPLAAAAPPGTYNKVNTGATYMANSMGEISILPNQMGFAGADKKPELQPLNLNIFTVAPAPQAGASQGGKVRDSAVVDGALQQQNLAPGFTMPPSITFSRTPITATYSCIVMSPIGQPMPATCTATF